MLQPTYRGIARISEVQREKRSGVTLSNPRGTEPGDILIAYVETSVPVTTPVGWKRMRDNVWWCTAQAADESHTFAHELAESMGAIAAVMPAGAIR